ncbi:ComF family protein [Variovorax sp. HJSM1_2]|uniref:ComF family protein n=1 Tax=Variovorax sp. HJSM1_2 TaxID=3366263 RepID=UPI003BC2555F
MFRALIQRLFTLGGAGLPSQCAICHAWPRDPFCSDCKARFVRPAQRCRTCALALPEGVAQCGACIREPPPLQQCLAAVDYAYPWDECLKQFKFRDQVGAAASLAALIQQTPGAAAALAQSDLLLPMPLAAERLRERGYNQALLLARQLAPDKTRAQLLLRIRHTPPQHGLTRAQRLRNLRGAFLVEPLQAAQVRQRRILLVDDVMTTGASLHAAALALRSAGAASVGALVVARTPIHS